MTETSTDMNKKNQLLFEEGVKKDFKKDSILHVIKVMILLERNMYLRIIFTLNNLALSKVVGNSRFF